MATGAEGTPPLCTRCKEHDGVLDLRSETVCRTCFTSYVASKAIKRLEVLQRETRSSRSSSGPQRYLLALSRGPSSTALLHILSENLRRHRERNQRAKFEMVVAFVDVDIDSTDANTAKDRRTPETTISDPSSVSALLNKTSITEADKPAENPPSSHLPKSDQPLTTDPFAAHFPDITIQTIPLSSILSSPNIDWQPLPAQDTTLSPPKRLADLFTRLPTPSARADVSRLLTRHALLAAAATHNCPVVLLGYNTTALAELTLSEAAKGRGFGIPWFVNDGAVPAVEHKKEDIFIYSPLREILRKEVLLYLSVAESAAGPLLDLFPDRGGGGPLGAVVSHRDLSLDDVVARYFVDVEASYPSVVANVVRTTGKLSRTAPVGLDAAAGIAKGTGTGAGGRLCGLCGVALDPLGDERWKGELGEADTGTVGAADGDRGRLDVRQSRLCYGCERSVKG
ncbi:hypothetical protein F4861DRAFT_489077 [Xylaria intraflava]|nr:hypothetical protein F4861DRAFT_489077 [Xylaria intraflava]